MNRRNYGIIFEENARSLFPLVNDKLLTKERLDECGIPYPPVYAIFEDISEARRVRRVLDRFPTGALKPACGHGGGGILILRGPAEGGYQAAGGVMSLAELEQHLAQILLGVYSLGGGHDAAFLEQLLVNDPALERFELTGVADIRVIVHRGEPVMAMLRLPTVASRGRANLHAGALGVGVDLATGLTRNGWLRRQPTAVHPDSGAPLAGFEIPTFSTILELSRRCYQAVPMGYMGVDIVLDASLGPVVIELNGRPGLEIQLANDQSLGDALQLASVATSSGRGLP